MPTLAQQHDCLLLDLDGTVYRGAEPTAGARETLDALAGPRVLFVTNNASRTALQVAAHLRELGFTASGDDVVTSAQAAAALLAEQLPAGARVLVVGTDALAGEIEGVGLLPVRRHDEQPVAVVQGHSPDTAWWNLAEAALAIGDGALWMAANVDVTLPTERGLLPGNGAMVAALRAATGRAPQIAGKPAPALLTNAAARVGATSPLVVGDRLDTDLAGACAAGLPSLMVLTGVSTAAETVWAAPDERPTYLAADLRGLNEEAAAVRVGPNDQYSVTVDGDTVTLTTIAGEDPMAALRALAHAVWSSGLERGRIVAADDRAQQALVAVGLA
ncbi:HAD-IIA family hydrolase [Mycobacterium sp. MYCO198283]|uniref:HAD-IIA family hydrolase n=1 Tax=Mycobacterium sp. MYCO198283 TaxID=2883505 RepID=UPI001E454E33|nr:HAD-IIA family hydrolase [Mycobacterium sp. MYCO198283]MCG5433102.1 HAD-IIA family hydrolase [Mycobacterium sp. MYCO198283]